MKYLIELEGQFLPYIMLLDLGYLNLYELVLVHVLRETGLDVKRQVPLPVIFNGIQLDGSYRIDLLVNDLVIVEIKSVEIIKSLHHLQLLTYLKLSGLKLGLLVNFNSPNISESIFRKS